MLRSFAIIVISIALCFCTACDECNNVVCSNGGTCTNGECLCDDGILRPFCKKDTCLESTKCVNGHCEYGFCICDQFWGGESCEVKIYINHAGDYFGGFACNNTSITNGYLDVTEVNQIDSFMFFERDLGYRYFAIFNTIDQFEVPRQLVRAVEPYVYVSGSGSVNGDQINYEIEYETDFSWYEEFDYCSFEGRLR